MKWTVIWRPSTENDLASLWLSAPDQDSLTADANAIDQELARNPLAAGEARSGTSRILIEPPLAVEYDVIVDDHKVVVCHVWRWNPPTP
jgi:hypothetical protein